MSAENFHDELLGMSWKELRRLQASTIDRVNAMDARLGRLRVRERMILDELVRRAAQDVEPLKSQAVAE